MTAIADYQAHIDAAEAQAERLRAGRPPTPDTWGGVNATRFRADLRQPLDTVGERLGAYLRPNDVLLDIGGGAGRMSLPLAGRCREVINIEPSAGMGEAFLATAAEAGISNARLVAHDWLSAAAVQGDVALCCNVTYFVREIGPFIAKLQHAARRRVFILVGSRAPFVLWADGFRRLFGEELVWRPSYRELLPVLWEAGILPDVEVVPIDMVLAPTPQTREAAITNMLRGLSTVVGADLRSDAGLRDNLNEGFDTLFTPTADGFQSRNSVPGSGLLISWDTGARA